jgi:hypothetical protein
MWPIHPKPCDGEALTSWLVRIARARGIRTHSLIEQLTPGLQFWTRDGDLIAPPELIARLADATGIDLARARQTTLGSLEGVLDETISGDHQSVMIRPLGVHHRTRRAYGQQYCPLCLAERPAYFRLNWRLRLFPVCTRHCIVLVDACHSCDCPIVAHRGEMTHCHICGVDLLIAVATPAAASVIQLQRHNEGLLVGNAVTWPFLAGLHPLAFFHQQFSLLRTVAGRRRSAALREAMTDQLGTPNLHFRDSAKHTRSLSSASSHYCMQAVELLLRGWPAMFAGYLQEARVWSSWIIPEEGRYPFPFVLRDAVDTYLHPGSSNAERH